VSGSTWSGSFLTDLDVRGYGQGGYTLPPAADISLPWSTIDRIVVEFNEPVVASAGQFSLAGVNLPSYGVASYSVDGNRATWTLSGPIASDKLLLTLPGTITDTSGNAMGNPHTHRFDVHPGDVNIDASVNRDDLVRNLLNQFTTPSLAAYDPLQDVDTNGRINILDWVRIRDRFGTLLPPGEPGGSPSAPEAAVATQAPRRGTATRMVTTDAAFKAPVQLTVGSMGRRPSATPSAMRVAPRTALNESVNEPLQARRSRIAKSVPDRATHDAVFAEM
jgi:hypothetical protein